MYAGFGKSLYFPVTLESQVMCWLHYQLLGELFQSADFVGTDLSMATCQVNYELLLYCITYSTIIMTLPSSLHMTKQYKKNR